MSSKDLNQVATVTGKDTGSQTEFYVVEALYYTGFVSQQSIVLTILDCAYSLFH
jgi:hypothetical protein